MFDIGWGELLLIGVVALIAIGPKELPGALRSLGQWMTKIRRMAAEFQNQFHEAMREAELTDLKKEVDEMAAKAQSYTHFDPIEDIRRDIEKAAGPLPDLDAPITGTPGATSSAAGVAPNATANATWDAPSSVSEAVAATSAEIAPPVPAAAAPAETAASLGAGKPDAGRAA